MNYYFLVLALNLVSGKAFKLGNRFYFDMESKATCVYVCVNVADGQAKVHNLTIHLLFGFGKVAMQIFEDFKITFNKVKNSGRVTSSHMLTKKC